MYTSFWIPTRKTDLPSHGFAARPPPRQLQIPIKALGRFPASVESRSYRKRLFSKQTFPFHSPTLTKSVSSVHRSRNYKMQAHPRGPSCGVCLPCEAGAPGHQKPVLRRGAAAAAEASPHPLPGLRLQSELVQENLICILPCSWCRTRRGREGVRTEQKGGDEACAGGRALTFLETRDLVVWQGQQQHGPLVFLAFLAG